jgi:hypothetical protein
MASGSVVFATILGLAFAGGAIADVPATVDVYGAEGHAAGVHEIFYSGNLTSFLNHKTKGAIDNRYPLATVNQDSSPASYASASSADYGPLVATVLAGDPPGICPGPLCPPHQSPPQIYAKAQYPGGPADNTYSLHEQGACKSTSQDCSEAHAKELGATAKGVYNGNPNQPGSPALADSTGESQTIVKQDGSILVTSHAHVGKATFGGDNGLVINDVDVVTSILSVGGRDATINTVVTHGAVTVAGQEQHIDDQGVTITTPAGNVTVPAGAPLNGSTPVVSYYVFAATPEKSLDNQNGCKGKCRGSANATGIHVVVLQPGGNPGGIPPSSTEYILGESQAEAFAVPPAPAPPIAGVLDNFPAGNDLGTVGQTSVTTTTIIQAPATVAAPSTLINRPLPKPKQTRTPRLALVAATRPNLALMFFLWEALVLGAAASIVWARRRQAEDNA